MIVVTELFSAEPVAVVAPTPVPVVPEGGRVFASPIARRIAKEMNIEISKFVGSGPNGRIILADVEEQAAAITAAPVEVAADAAPVAFAQVASGNFTDHPHTHTRQQIADQLTASKRNVPHYYLTVDVNLDEAMAVRSKFNAMMGADSEITLNDMIVKATALASKKVPDCNSAWMESYVRQFHYVDVSVAMSVEDGTVSPVIRDVHSKGLADISAEVRSLSEKAQVTISPHISAVLVHVNLVMVLCDSSLSLGS